MLNKPPSRPETNDVRSLDWGGGAGGAGEAVSNQNRACVCSVYITVYNIQFVVCVQYIHM